VVALACGLLDCRVVRRAAIVVAFVVLTATPSTARAEGGPFGLGIILGEPTGLTGAYRLSPRNMIDGAIGIDVFDDNEFYVHADFLFVLPDLLGGGSVGLSPYLGPGAFVVDIADGIGLGGRIPFGLSLDFRRAPIQIFGEITFSLLVVPDVHGDIGGAIGFRYYF
jgi:hypothetical protein